MGDIYLTRKLGPLAYTMFNNTNGYGVNQVYGNVILIDSIWFDESYLFYSSQSDFAKYESEIRKTRKITNPSNLVYKEYQRSFTFNNPSYNKVKGYKDYYPETGIIKAGHIIDFNTDNVDVYSIQAFIEMVLLEVTERLPRAIKRLPLIEIMEKVEYVNEDGFVNRMKRALGVGGVKEKIHYSSQIDTSKMSLQTIVNNSINKVKKSLSKEDREKIDSYSGVVIFRLLLTDKEKGLDVLYSR